MKKILLLGLGLCFTSLSFAVPATTVLQNLFAPVVHESSQCANIPPVATTPAGDPQGVAHWCSSYLADAIAQCADSCTAYGSACPANKVLICAGINTRHGQAITTACQGDQLPNGVTVDECYSEWMAFQQNCYGAGQACAS